MGLILITSKFRKDIQETPVIFMLGQIRFIISLSLPSFPSPPAPPHHVLPITTCSVPTSPSRVPWILPGII
jgi:hypothetical protein